jgi:hypothetical protein
MIDPLPAERSCVGPEYGISFSLEPREGLASRSVDIETRCPFGKVAQPCVIWTSAGAKNRGNPLWRRWFLDPFSYFYKDMVFR